MSWQPIETAPRNKDLLVGKFVGKEWRICQSGFYYDSGSNAPDTYEPGYWYWCSDWDRGGITDYDGPTHWMPLPEPPQ